MNSQHIAKQNNSFAEQSTIHEQEEPQKFSPLQSSIPNLASGLLSKSNIMSLQRTHGNQFVQRLVANKKVTPIQGLYRMAIQREDTSFPEDAEERVKEENDIQTKRIQRQADPSAPIQRKTPVKLNASGAYSASIQRRGGKKMGKLYVVSNVVSAGLTAGHAWLRLERDSGGATTYGTWGNRDPIGLHRDLELPQGRGAASRGVDVDNDDITALDNFANSHNTWGYTRNCSWFAALGWWSVTGESIPHTTFGIPNPSALGAGIVGLGGTLDLSTQGSSTSVGNSGGSSSAQGSGSSAQGSNTVSSGGSSL